MAFPMAKLLQTLALISLLLMQAYEVHSQADNTTTFNYDSFDPKPEDLIYEGDVQVVPGYSFLRLTNALVLYSKPVKIWEREQPHKLANFETIIRVNITPPLKDLPPRDLQFVMLDFDGEDSVGRKVLGIDIINPARRKSASDDTAGQMVYLSVKYEEGKLSGFATDGTQNYTQSPVIADLPQLCQVGIWSSTTNADEVNDLHSWYFSSTLVHDKPISKEDKKVDQEKSENEDTYIKQYV